MFPVFMMVFFFWLHNTGRDILAWCYDPEKNVIKIKVGDKYFYLDDESTWEPREIRETFFNNKEGGLLIKCKDFSSFIEISEHRLWIEDGMEIKLKP